MDLKTRVITDLLDQHLDEITKVELHILRELDLPLLKLVAGMPEDVLFARTKESLENMLKAVAAGTHMDVVRASVRRWEGEEVEGIKREQVLAADLAGVYSAQKRAILGRLPAVGLTIEDACAFSDELLAAMSEMETALYETFGRIAADAAGRAIKAEAELAAAEAAEAEVRKAHEALQAAHEELQLTHEELEAAHEELQTNHEEMQALYEEQTAQAEELQAQQEELHEVALRDRLQTEQIEALQCADAIKDQFLAMVSHELRTPINAITGFGSILLDGLAGQLTDTQQAYLHKMLGGADILLMLVDDLLDMGRLQAGRFSLDIGFVQLQGVAERVVQMVAPLAEQRGHTLVSDWPEELPAFRGDQRRLAQVCFNLLQNAIKFTPDGGRITLRLRSSGGTVRCEVEDTGPGIPEEDIQRAFQPFTQLDIGAERRAGGAGLGLSISKALIEAHGGQIGIESHAGAGARIWFEVPVLREASAP